VLEHAKRKEPGRLIMCECRVVTTRDGCLACGRSAREIVAEDVRQGRQGRN